MKKRIPLALALIMTTTIPGSCIAVTEIPAFPGAEGFGANAKGGRGGKVIFVENLNDSGSGSLRAALEASGPRTIVFRTGGTITLRSQIVISNPYVTIAGQTAPGSGIAIKTNGFAGDGSVFQIKTHNVIIRHVRIRTAPPKGDFSGKEAWESWVDPISMWTTNAHDIIIDRTSTSWGSKDQIRAWGGAHNITIQNSILSEGLKTNGHKGALFGGGADKVTLYKNLFVHNRDRNPWIKADEGEDYDATNTTATFQVVNNVIYNTANGIRVGAVNSPSWAPNPGMTYANVIGNYYKPGPITNVNWHEILVGHKTKVYVKGNIGTHRTNDSMDDWASVGLNWLRADQVAPANTRASASLYRATKPFSTPAIATVSAVKAYDDVLKNVGANKPGWDAVDKRVINDVKNGTGKIIDEPLQVGGWPTLDKGTPPADMDKDGMPDAWERQNGFNPNDPNDRNGDADGDGYTNLEEYINSIA